STTTWMPCTATTKRGSAKVVIRRGLFLCYLKFNDRPTGASFISFDTPAKLNYTLDGSLGGRHVNWRGGAIRSLGRCATANNAEQGCGEKSFSHGATSIAQRSRPYPIPSALRFSAMNLT